MDDFAGRKVRRVVEAGRTERNKIFRRVTPVDRAAAFGTKYPAPHAAFSVVVVFVSGGVAMDDQTGLGCLDESGKRRATQFLAIAALTEDLKTQRGIQFVADCAAVASSGDHAAKGLARFMIRVFAAVDIRRWPQDRNGVKARNGVGQGEKCRNGSGTGLEVKKGK